MSDEKSEGRERASMMDLARAASKKGTLVNLTPVGHCGVMWSSDPTALVFYSNGGWTRTGRCGKCDVDLVPFQEVLLFGDERRVLVRCRREGQSSRVPRLRRTCLRCGSLGPFDTADTMSCLACAPL
jgi:hypothetical protein